MKVDILAIGVHPDDIELGCAGTGFFEHSKENILKISAVIRKYKPEIVLANAITDRHPDHGRASKLISDACFYSGLQKIEQVDENGQELEKWRPKAVYHYIQDRNLRADFVVDISPFMDKKLESILAYKTQFYLENASGPKTPISGKDFLEFNRAKNKAYGRDIGAEYAEGFTVDRNIGVNNLFDLS